MNSIMTIDIAGNRFWMDERNRLHRENGPAIESSNGIEYWYLNGEKHRSNGPAVEYNPLFNKDLPNKWYMYGVDLEDEAEKWRETYNLGLIFDEWTKDMQMLFKLTWGGNF